MRRKKTHKSNLEGRKFWSEKLQQPFRSNWEIFIAELLTELGIKYEFEPERVYFRKEHESYLYDFYLPDFNVVIEVKGYMDAKSEKRCKLFKKYYGAKHGFFLVMKDEMELLKLNPELIFTYIGIAQEELRRVRGNELHDYV
jgi:hypothetical protein